MHRRAVWRLERPHRRHETFTGSTGIQTEPFARSTIAGYRTGLSGLLTNPRSRRDLGSSSRHGRHVEVKV